jgi:hypothetical protein
MYATLFRDFHAWLKEGNGRQQEQFGVGMQFGMAAPIRDDSAKSKFIRFGIEIWTPIRLGLMIPVRKLDNFDSLSLVINTTNTT